MFGEYLNKAMRLIKDLTIGTPSDTLINQVKCGRDSFQKLREHYDGKSEGEKRKHRQVGAQEILLSPLTYLLFWSLHHCTSN